MAKYKIEFKKSAVKELKPIPKKDLKIILSKINDLADNPRPNESVKLTSREQYKIRHGNYRILYSIEDDRLVISAVKTAHRKDVYK
ncbi:MAG TPA: type II toxin-antitoxin system RelE/ParE family toxin [bacterium]|nr:type II toxin-antitoxin system RelE/ParE family toxin [bacterium]